MDASFKSSSEEREMESVETAAVTATPELYTEAPPPSSATDQMLLSGPASAELGTNLGVGRDVGKRYLLFIDLVLVWLSAGVADMVSLYFAKAVRGPSFAIPPPAGLLGFLFLFSVLVVLYAHIHGLYARFWQKSFAEEVKYLGKSVCSAALVLIAVLLLVGTRAVSVLALGPTIVLSWLTLAAWRRFLHAQSIPGLSDKRNVLIVGGGPAAKQLKDHLDKHPKMGYVVKGFLDRRNQERTINPGENYLRSGFLGNMRDLASIVRSHFIDEVFVCVPHDRRLVMEIAKYAQGTGVHLRVIPELYETVTVSTAVEYVGRFPTLTIQQLPIPTIQLAVKRLVDILISALALIVLTPFLLLITAIVKLESKGPALYGSFRVGRKGITFRCFKFRTMVQDADALKQSLSHMNERDGVLFKISDDPRITRAGKMLRKYSVDELPQLWNVFLGHLSLVGPRPHPLDDYSHYTLEHRRRLEAKPGITGLWQVTARRDPSFEKNVALDIEYIQTWSLWLDFRILWKTVGVVIAGTGQ
jgi:exopolysaccharide biosynthesis polyprenyl glycosylphosphotransferase